MESSLNSRTKFTKNSSGLSCVNNQERSAFSLNILPIVLRAWSQKTMILVTSHIKPIWQGQADLPGSPGPKPYSWTVCAVASQANTHRLGTIFRLLPWLPFLKKKKKINCKFLSLKLERPCFWVIINYKLRDFCLIPWEEDSLWDLQSKVVILCLEHRELVINFFLLL